MSNTESREAVGYGVGKKRRFLAMFGMFGVLAAYHLIGNGRTSEIDSKMPRRGLQSAESRVNELYLGPWPEVPDKNWCTVQGEVPKEDPKEGFIYVKVYKTSSSTSAGVALRVAREVGKRMGLSRCAVRYGHGLAMDREFDRRNKAKSFMWSMVRNPSRRALSHVFFFTITQGHREPTDERVINGIQKASPEGRGGFQVNYLSTYRYEENLTFENPEASRKVVEDILYEYDFLGVAERYDESMVALRLILGLEAGDVMHLDSKVGGGYDMKCNKIVKSFTTDAVKDYMESRDWEERNIADTILYEAANLKLDQTIEKLGRERFQAAFDEHQRLRKLMQEQCADKAVFPCTDGVDTSIQSKRNCYSRDFGCGYPCIDEVLQESSSTN